jgi:hypothetical protein
VRQATTNSEPDPAAMLHGQLVLRLLPPVAASMLKFMAPRDARIPAQGGDLGGLFLIGGRYDRGHVP